MRNINNSKQIIVAALLGALNFSACKKDKESEDCADESEDGCSTDTGSVVSTGGTTSGTGDGADSTAPTVGTGPSFSYITAHGFTVSWTAATDDATAAADLEYRLVTAAAVDDLATADQAEGVTGADVALEWSKAELSVAMTDLAPETSMAFAVLVRDAAGNVSLYPAESVTTLDEDAPTPGGELSFSNITHSTFSVAWDPATSPASAQANLQYRAVIATSSSAIDTIDEAAALTGSDVILDWTANHLAAAAAGVHFGSDYWATVLVKDEEGRMSIYTPAMVETLHYRLIFATDASYPSTLLGTVADADAACEAAKPQGRSGSFKALYAGATRTACTNAYCNPLVSGDLNDWPMLPTTSYESLAGELLWTTGTRPIVAADASISQLAAGVVQAWTGLNADWTYASANCTDWSSAAGNISGTFGWASNTNDAIWSGYSTLCSSQRRLYCVEQ